MIFKKILDTLTFKAVRQRLDRRKLQEELDLHRLYLLTAYRSRSLQGVHLGEDAAAQLDEEARQLGLEGTRAAVASNLGQQVRDICTTLHHILSVVDDVVAAEAWRKLYEESAATASPRPRQKGLAGLGAAVAPEPEPTSPPLAPQLLPPSRLTRLQVADAFLETAGFALHAAPSSIKHEDSGTGLWLRGSVGVGQLVGLYPGVSYGPEYHRQIPGYPLVARTNPYLLARFDGVVLDAKPWGAGREGGSREEEGAEKSGSGWPQEPANAAEAQLALLEGRNPVALAHLANHPPSGTQPNVMVAALDWEPPPEVAPELRAYFPVIDYGQAHTDSAAARRRIPGVALVATRDISDEELFLNYRLNPNAPAGLPSWYSPVDGAEDDRRWA